jgi:hypothetical protein
MATLNEAARKIAGIDDTPELLTEVVEPISGVREPTTLESVYLDLITYYNTEAVKTQDKMDDLITRSVEFPLFTTNQDYIDFRELFIYLSNNVQTAIAVEHKYNTEMLKKQLYDVDPQPTKWETFKSLFRRD